MNDGTLMAIYVRDENFKSVGSSKYSPDFITHLEKGIYYVTFSVKYYGDYIPSHSMYEESTYFYAFCVLKK